MFDSSGGPFGAAQALTGNAPTGLAVAHINLDSLRHNWRHLTAKAGSPPLAVVKADAYGHGMAATARTLLDEGCRFFAVGSVAEGVDLRKTIADADGRDVPVLPLIGILNVEDARAAVEYGLTPLVHTAGHAVLVSEAYSGETPLPVAIKVETGMARLGFRGDQVGEMIALLREKRNLEPKYLVSHMAAADEPEQEASVAAQVSQFVAIFQAMRAVWPGITPSLANSAAYILQDRLLADLTGHIGRLGYALYGGNPFAGTSLEHWADALLPVMEVTAPVLAVHDIAKGQTVSYGRTFTAPRNMRIAVIGAGYSDGFSRGLSGKGRVCVGGVKCPILGRVCMQMHMVDVTGVPLVSPGDTAYLLGGEEAGRVSAEELAKAWETIPYEIFCILGKNRHVYSGKA